MSIGAEHPEIVTVLRSSEAFSSLDAVELGELASVCKEITRSAGELVFREGGRPHSLFIVSHGRIKVLKHSSRGKEHIIGFFGPGEMVGEVAVFEERPYPASAEAVENSRLIRILREDFVAYLVRRPSVALHIIRVLGSRLRTAQGRLMDSTTERAQQRLARILLMLVRRVGPTLPFTREELGQMTGLTTETVSRQIGEFSAMGILNLGRRELVIVDEDRLVLLSEGPFDS
ncbi:MAG: Crp/Fnr family transcriptional regulator [Dehalococcoidia bacterium]|nr:Crp/Fnr family transcriptional regulator [Dehalococcoidia bacterium]